MYIFVSHRNSSVSNVSMDTMVTRPLWVCKVKSLIHEMSPAKESLTYFSKKKKAYFRAVFVGMGEEEK